jgi:hypothetical protein
MEAAERRALELGRTLLVLDTESGSAAERLYERRSWVRYGMVPDFAYRPDRALRPSSFFYKQLAPTNLRRGGRRDHGWPPRSLG